jgi:hypothetical protein
MCPLERVLSVVVIAFVFSRANAPARDRHRLVVFVPVAARVGVARVGGIVIDIILVVVVASSSSSRRRRGVSTSRRRICQLWHHYGGVSESRLVNARHVRCFES